ncbi:MAG: 16S rRNA (uracil(1498)-N(3))-methyltransferase [Magnetococcus sp. WYHC-3]
MIPRLYHPHPLVPGQFLTLGREAGHYLARVLRLRSGEPVVLFNGRDGLDYPAIIQALEPELTLRLDTPLPNPAESPLTITLVHGLAKSTAMELVIQKAVELGVARILPLVCRHVVGRPDAQRDQHRRERWNRIAAEAAEQCRRARVPEILSPLPWEALPAHLAPHGPRLLCWEQNDGLPPLASLGSRWPRPEHVTLLTGPEGGFAADEVASACADLGFTAVSLGPRILRSETAAITAVTLAQVLWGDLQ